MIKSDSNYCNSSSSSTGSDCLSDNSKNIDTVTQLFSNLLRSSESSTNLLCRSPNSVSHSNLHINHTPLVKQESNSEENDRINFFSNDHFQTPKQSKVSNDNFDISKIQSNFQKTNSRQLPCFAASHESAISDKSSKDLCTPCNSKIPVFHTKSDPTDFYESEKKTPTGPTGRRPLNPETLRRNRSSSKIPIRNSHKRNNEVYSLNKSPVDYFRNVVRQTERNEQIVKSDRNCVGKYNHVKSKLAAYIHRPSKITDSKCVYTSSNIKTNSKSSLENKKIKDDCSHLQNANFSSSYHIKRVESRTSLDTYTCDYKMPLADFSCADCFKQEDLPRSSEKARGHLEQAAEHCRVKLENCRIIEEHERIIDKHRRMVLEHEEKSTEHKLKAIGFILNRIT